MGISTLSCFFWGMLGVVSFIASISGFSRLKPNEKSLFWRPKEPNISTKILKRARLALSPRYWVFAWPVLLTPFMVMGLMTYFNVKGMETGDGWQLLVSLLCAGLGYLASFAVGYFIFLRKSLSNYRLEIAKLGAKMVARLAMPEEAYPLLLAASQDRSSAVRLASTVGFKELGTLDHLPVLEKLSKDADAEVVKGALEALLSLQKLLITTPISVKQMDTLVGNHQKLELKRKPNSEISTNVDYDEYYEKTQKRIEEIVFSQVQLRQAFPNIYCKHCYSRAEQLRYLEWDWVRCLKCQDVQGLVTGVERVTGQIGAAVDWHLEKGELKLNLWDETTHKARNATMSALEIVGGRSMDYDWAVSAVLEKLLNENPDYGIGIQVFLVNHPPLSQNSLQLLHNLDSAFIG